MQTESSAQAGGTGDRNPAGPWADLCGAPTAWRCWAHGRQGMPLRGHREHESDSDDDSQGTDGASSHENLVALVKSRPRYGNILAEALKNAPKNATYTSKTIQDELIQILGNQITPNIAPNITQSWPMKWPTSVVTSRLLCVWARSL